MSIPPPALLIHGAGGGGWEWNIWRAVLQADGWDAQAPDLAPAAEGLAATRWTDYLAQVESWSRASTAPPVLIGASLGGLLAMAVAAVIPVAALVLINPLPPLPEASSLPPQPPWSDVVPWRQQARLSSTQRSMPEADAAASLYAFRRWRDESAAVLNEARAGLNLPPTRVPCLLLASRDDVDTPYRTSQSLAMRIGADFLSCDGGHLAPLMGRDAARHAQQTVAWLNARGGFRAD